jgi:hypothetical protein
VDNKRFVPPSGKGYSNGQSEFPRSSGFTHACGANLTVENQQVIQNSEICRTDSARNQGDSGDAPFGKMKFPVKVTFRKAEAK